MIVLIKYDSLHFRRITNTQRDNIIKLANALGLVTTISAVSLNAYGKQSALFVLLYELSKSFDIEII